MFVFAFGSLLCSVCCQMAINEGSTLHLTSDVVKMERDTYVYRAYVAAGQPHVVLDEIKDSGSTPMDLQAVKLLATYLSNPDSREVAVLTASQWLTEPETGAAAGCHMRRGLHLRTV